VAKPRGSDIAEAKVIINEKFLLTLLPLRHKSTIMIQHEAIFTMKKIVRDYQRLCTTEGFDLRGIAVRGGHYALQFERGMIFCPSTPSTPSDHRNMRNLRASIRRLHA
jgi:hypothetical protein